MVPDISPSTDINQLEEEILIIRKSISLAAQGFDFVVDALHSAG